MSLSICTAMRAMAYSALVLAMQAILAFGNIPAFTPGIPLSVVRTYDSFNTGSGDFGKAWTLAIHDLEIELDEERAPSSNPSITMRVGGERNVTLTLPDGRRTTFGYRLVPGKPEGEGELKTPCFCYEARFESAPGVFARLGTVDNDRIMYLFGTSQFPAFWNEAGPATPLENYDFSGFVLTNEDGAEYTISRELLAFEDLEFSEEDSILREVPIRGKPRLSSIRTKSGEVLEIDNSPGGFRITHFADE